MDNLPSGTITFLFTDIEGSMKLWGELPEAMRGALARHDQLLREAITRHNGVVFKTVGDAFYAAFCAASDALMAALNIHIDLQNEEWGAVGTIRVRIGLHTGEAEKRDNDYFGQTLNRVARLQAAGHGQQTLLSQATYQLVCDNLPPSVSILELGSHRFKDLPHPEQVFQLVYPGLQAEFSPLKSLGKPTLPTNLPQQFTSFIGREKEMTAVKSFLLHKRLLTLTGEGGNGKTRLALQVAAEVQENYPDGVILVELASLADPSFVAQTVASLIGMKEQAGQTIQQSLIEVLKSKQALLLLDNCEHLRTACAQFAAALVLSCPNVSLLATSREALGITGEQIYRVSSLPLPDPKHPINLEALPRYEGVQLFIERARLVSPDFDLTEQNAPALVHLCSQLDGIPLAIELAAARMRSLSVKDIDSHLHDCFRILKSGNGAAQPRQQTLQAAIDWSYNLLNEEEQQMFCRLSVFADGCAAKAAESICAPDTDAWEVVDLLSSLVDKSLVIYERQDGADRYRLLETMRQYCHKHLVEKQENHTLRDRHCAYFLQFAEEAEPHLEGPHQSLWLNSVEAEHDNLRAALAWTINSETQMHFISALWWFWYVRGYLSEGRGWAEGALMRSTSNPTVLRAKVLHGAAILAGFQGDYPKSQALHTDALAISRTLNDAKGVADALHGMGIMARRQGDNTRARQLYEESLAIRRQTKDKRGIARSVTNLGIIAGLEKDYAAAQAYYDEGEALYRELGDKQGLATLLTNFACLFHMQNDLSAARLLYEESLQIKREISNKEGVGVSVLNLVDIARMQGDYTSMWQLLQEGLNIFSELGDEQHVAFAQQHVILALEACAVFLLRQGQPDAAARLFGSAEILREVSHSHLQQQEAEEHDRNAEAIRDVMGERACAEAWKAGRMMTLEQAVAYAGSKTAEAQSLSLEPAP